jgi:hypothetical protein
MGTYNHGSQHHGLKLCLGFAIVFLAGFVASAGAQESLGVPAKPADTKPVGHPRKATLKELYGMFFVFAAHVEATADAGTERGQDMKFYREHLQKASGLDAVEYASVLESAQKFAAEDADVNKQLSDEIKTIKESGVASIPKSQLTEYSSKIKSLMAQRSASLDSEIATVRQSLGKERTKIFESYLQTEYNMHRIGPTPPESNSSEPMKQSEAKPENQTVTVDPNSCEDFGLEDGGVIEVCADAQISYLGSPTSNTAEFYASLSANVNDPYGADITGYEVEGDFFINDLENDTLDCDLLDSDKCVTDAELAYGSGTTYSWTTTATIDLDYDLVDCDPDYCYADDFQWTSPTAAVTINYPDVNTLSTSTFGQGTSGTFIIDGQYLMSVFENTPTVTVADQGTIFSSFEITPPDSYPDGDITVTYTVLNNAPAGTYALTVNNGFGSDSYDITIGEQPVITGITASGSADVLEAATQQTVTLTGKNFGSAAPTVNVASDGQYVTVDTVSTHTETTVSFTATTAGSAPQGTASFQLVTSTGDATSPEIAVDPISLPPPQVMMVTSPAAQQNCTGGTEIDGQTASVYAGQQLLLCSPAPSLPPGVTVTSSVWSAPMVDLTGGYCAPYAYTQCEVSGAGQELADPVMSGVSNVSLYWVNPGNTETITYQYCVDNSITQCAVSALATFSVNGPTQAPGASGIISTVTNLVTISGPPYLGFGSYNAQGNPVTVGINFISGALAPVGTFQWVQTINTDEFTVIMSTGVKVCSPNTRVGSGSDPQGVPELDNVYPYPTFSSPNTYDAPASGLPSSQGEQQHLFSATMYLMWDPTLNQGGTACQAASTNGSLQQGRSTCTGSIPIPLGAVTWEWAGCAVNTLNPLVGVGGWHLNCENFTPSTSVVLNSSYPQWIHISMNQSANGSPTWSCADAIDEVKP